METGIGIIHKARVGLSEVKSNHFGTKTSLKLVTTIRFLQIGTVAFLNASIWINSTLGWKRKYLLSINDGNRTLGISSAIPYPSIFGYLLHIYNDNPDEVLIN
jgi:hypothetical protein